MCPEPAPIPDAEAESLRREVDHWHECLFGGPAPAEVRERYVDAHRHLDLGGRAPSGAALARIVEERLDAEAIELHLRRRDPENRLTAKLRVLLYLVELRCEYYPRFVRERGSFLGSLPGLVLAVTRSAIKAVRGRRQARRIDAA